MSLPGIRPLRGYLLPLLPLLAVLMLTTQAYAQNDPRMVVEIVKNEQGELLSIQDAIGEALPRLWDRILPVASRGSVSDSVNATPFLQRVVPHGGGLQVIFNEQRVYQYLDQQQVVYLKEVPHLNVEIRMFNQNDLAMPKTVDVLRAYAEEVAKDRGIVLDAGAVPVTATWRWLENGQLSLNVRGKGLDEPVSEIRPVTAGEELEQLQGWVAELILQLRDRSLSGIDASAGEVGEVVRNEAELLLTIEQRASLPEQVALEEALQLNDRVELLQPIYLSSGSRQYRLRLREYDDSWIKGWFARRGMLAQQTVDGWIVR